MTAKNRVAYLTSEYPAISHTFILREVEGLRQKGYEVATLSIRNPSHLERMTDLEKSENLNTNYIKETPLFSALKAHLRLFVKNPIGYLKVCCRALKSGFRRSNRLLKHLAYLAEAGVVLDLLEKKQIKHLHVHFGNPAATVAWIAHAYGGISYSLSIHGPDDFDNIQANMITEKISEARFIRCISYYCKSQLLRWIPPGNWERFHVVRCGINPDVYKPRPEPHNTIPEILCVGRLVPAKGQHLLLNACQDLFKRNIPFHLTFVGDGPDRSSLESLVKRSGMAHLVTFTGALGQDDVQKYYNRADLFVLPSFAEGIPVVLMEAMAKGIAAISTRVMGIPELIEDRHNGILIPPAEIEILIQQLISLIENKALRDRLGSNGREKILMEYNLNSINGKMGELFDKYSCSTYMETSGDSPKR